MALDPQKAVTQYKLDVWQAEQGLVQNSILAVKQTHDGYLWLGTLRGLVCFDGIRFKVFNKDNTGQLKDNVIRALCEDRRGILWIGTSGGGLSCLENGEFKTYSPNKYPGLKEISVIFEDRAGILWIGTINSGLTRLENGVFTTYTTADGLAGNKVRDFHQDKEGHLWIATADGLTIQPSPGTFIPFTGKAGPFDKYIISLCKTKKGELWLGCDDGLYCLKEDTFTRYGIDDGLPNLVIKCLLEDKDQNLWAGTDGGGLIRIKNGEIDTLSTVQGLACDFIWSLHEDKKGSLWVGTKESGLHRLRDTPVTTFTTREGLSHDKVSSILEDREGNLWIGTRGGGVSRLKNGKVTATLTTRDGLLSNVVYSISEDSNGNIWIGTDSGLNRFNQGKLTGFTTRDGLSHNWIFQLLEDKNGAIWIITLNNPNRFYKGEFSVFNPLGKGTDKVIQYLYESREGSLWFAVKDGGLYRWKQEKITPFTTKEGLVNNEIEGIHEDESGIFYIATRGGLSRLADGKFTNYTTKSGLVDCDVRHILEDRWGRLWLACPTGIYCIDKKELSDFANSKIEQINPLVFDESDGLITPWCEEGIRTRDGRLWFTSNKGVVMIDPANIKPNPLSYPVIIEELKVDGEQVDIKKNPLVIPPGKKRLEFHYTAPAFVKPLKMRFKIKLEGYEKEWLDNGNARVTTFTGLSPGKYTLEVMACSGDGVWSRESTSFSFYMQPLFYQTPWFYVTIAVVVLLSAFSFYRLRVRQLRAREKELSALVEQRTGDLKERNLQLEKARQKIQHSKELLEEQSEKLKEMDKVKSRFFANISHEFRTPLTLIMGPLEQVLSDYRDKKLAESIHVALRNSQRLLSLINQLLDLSKLESEKMKLEAAQQNIIPFLRGFVGSFESLMVQRQLNLIFHTEEETIELYYDPEKLEKVIGNLISNAVKFTPADGKITVSAQKQPSAQKNYPCGYLEISVEDTGMGIPANQLPYIFDRFYQAEGVFSHEHKHKGSGIGLALVKELVTLHHGEISVQSSEDQGTRFTLRLPLGNTHLKPEEMVPAAQLQSTGTKTSDIPPHYMIERESENGEIEKAGEHEEAEKGTGAGKNGEQERDVILVVEDNADVRRFIRQPLAALYTVVEAADGREGIEKAREIIPDLIISDVMMPQADGYELCRALKTDVTTSHIPIILLTAKASEESIIEGLETGADDYITKPFNTQILLTRIKNLVNLRRQLQENVQREMMLQPAEISVSSLDQGFMQELKEAIEKNISEEEFGVDSLAGVLYMSRATLNRKVRALTGESTNQFIQSYRLKRAAQLLKTNFGNVTEVAFAVGFSSSAYFTRCFKEKFHQLPHTFQVSAYES